MLLSSMDQSLTHEKPVFYLLNKAYNAIRTEVRKSFHLIATPNDVEPLFVGSLDIPVGDSEDITIADTIEQSPFTVEIPHKACNHDAVHAAILTLADHER